MWRGNKPLFMDIKDIERRKRSILVWSYLKGSDPEIIGHSLEERMKRQDRSCLEVISRLGAKSTSRQVRPLVFGGLD